MRISQRIRRGRMVQRGLLGLALSTGVVNGVVPTTFEGKAAVASGSVLASSLIGSVAVRRRTIRRSLRDVQTFADGLSVDSSYATRSLVRVIGKGETHLELEPQSDETQLFPGRGLMDDKETVTACSAVVPLGIYAAGNLAGRLLEDSVSPAASPYGFLLTTALVAVAGVSQAGLEFENDRMEMVFPRQLANLEQSAALLLPPASKDMR